MTDTVNPESFAQQLLRGIGAPVTPRTVGFIEAWEASEGGNWRNTARYNPLNTTLPEPGGVAYAPGKSVKAYSSWAEGLRATVSTLLDPRYRSVVSALNNDDPAGAQAALAASPWDAGHYSGGFPTSAAGAAYAKQYSDGKHSGGGLLGTIGGAISGAAGAVKGAAGNALGFAEDPAGTIAGAAEKGAGAVLSPVVDEVKNVLVRVTFVAGGLVLVVLGGYQLTKPITDKVKPIAQDAAGAAALAAA